MKAPEKVEMMSDEQFAAWLKRHRIAGLAAANAAAIRRRKLERIQDREDDLRDMTNDLLEDRV